MGIFKKKLPPKALKDLKYWLALLLRRKNVTWTFERFDMGILKWPTFIFLKRESQYILY